MTIFSQTIAGNQTGPRLLILAGVHGDEFEPMAAVRKLATLIDPQRLRGQVTLVPIVNLPAFRNARRTGPDELDLARTMPGRSDGSITEQIAAATTVLIRQNDFLIDLHTGGVAMEISPLAGYMLHDDERVLTQQRKMAHAFNLPIIWGTSSKLNGRTLSVARDCNIPAIYAEWGGGSGCDARGVQDYVDGCLNVMHALQMWEQPTPSNRVRYVVEDAREQSGVLQINSPAPQAGFFEPACNLNDHLRAGDLLGRIHSMCEEPSVEIRAEHSGLVILLRAIPSVMPGDCLATILEAPAPGEYRYV
ncbi:succinylglutamate desuccinylase/aspartoacylase family protein [Planctomicrobium sp. SH661]|uniref:succinylglutamate desuccinylase/aspartoacylase family protein n=1 Tax=Planctomicrobium sp. SH661 TaxID=3448124 RepID=UPI003F5C09A1